MAVAQPGGEPRLTALYQSLPLALGISRNGINLDANPAYLRMFGYDSLDEIVGTSILQQIASRCHADIRENIRRRAAGELLPPSYETVGVRKDGSEFPFRIAVGTGHTQEGMLTVVAIEDLTELKRTQEQVAEASELERLLVAASPIGILVWAAGGHCVSANEAAQRLLGGTLEQLAALNFRDLRSWKGTTLLGHAEKALDTFEPQSGEISTFGREVWFSYHLTPFQRAGQRYLLTQLVDITQRKRSEEVLRRSELNLTRAQRIAGMGSWSRNLATNEVHYSTETCRILGLVPRSPGSFDGLIALIHPDDRAQVRRKVEEAIAHRQPYKVDYRLIRPDGVERVCGAEADVILDDAGNPVELVGTLQDVTEARRQQSRINDLLNRERAARLDAEVANRAKDQFLATLSHELRTPLTSILGWTQLLCRAETDPDVTRRGIEVIQQSARLQAEIVDDLLDVSRIIANKQSVELRLASAAPATAAAVESFKVAAEKKRIRLSMAIDPPMTALVSVDPTRLQQIVSNLVGNAVKFSPEEGTVEVRLRQDGDHVRITVTDSGIGIEPDFLPRIFDRFSQADSSTTRKHGGLGLGLSISSHLVRMMGGDIRAESGGKDLGSTFTVLLPIAQVSVAESSVASAAPARRGGDSNLAELQRIEGLHLLLVDDDSAFLEVFSEMIASFGASVRTASSAREALRVLDDERIDLIISDIAMPEMDGVELIRRIRRRSVDEGGQIPALALTAFAANQDMQRALAAGFQKYLAKPVDVDQLCRTIVSYAGPRRAGVHFSQ